jgi:hypothetical protein
MESSRAAENMLWIEKRRKISRTERGQLAPAGVGGDVGRRERAVPTIDLRAVLFARRLLLP